MSKRKRKKNKIILSKKAVYLCGAMEKAENLGSGWRNDLTPFIREEIGHEVLDPCELEEDKLKRFRHKKLPPGCNHWHEMKNSKDPAIVARFNRYMRTIIKFDIDMIQDDSGYLIVYWDDAASKGAGTHSEMTIAFLEGLPVFCVITQLQKMPWWWKVGYRIFNSIGFNIHWPKTMPAWARACCTKVFDDFDGLKDYLLEEFGDDAAQKDEIVAG